eukprot:gene20847-22891_t
MATAATATNTQKNQTPRRRRRKKRKKKNGNAKNASAYLGNEMGRRDLFFGSQEKDCGGSCQKEMDKVLCCAMKMEGDCKM